MTCVLITGANRGIGRALAQKYESSGAQVIATSRSGETGYSLDVTDPESHHALANRLASRPVDLLICNAGTYLDKGFGMADYDAATWASGMATNVSGVFLTVQTFLDNVKLSAAGKIAIISSRMGSQEMAPGGSYLYRASKAAALNIGRNLAVDLRASGIAVGIYHPGWVRTDMGGSAADVSAIQSANGLIERFAALSMETTGCFESWDGDKLAF